MTIHGVRELGVDDPEEIDSYSINKLTYDQGGVLTMVAEPNCTLRFVVDRIDVVVELP